MEFDESKVCYGMVSIISENMQPCKDSIFILLKGMIETLNAPGYSLLIE
jgi:hypothetical protein